jgi:abhydrolase domain-containing protein 5
MGNKESKQSNSKNNEKNISEDCNKNTELNEDTSENNNESLNLVLEPDADIKKRAYEIEREILKDSGLILDKELWVEDIYIDYYGKNYLHTLRCGHPEQKIQNNLVIIHGYQGSSITFHKLFKHFYPKYNIYCPDVIGMALSSRPVVNFKSTEEWLEFFIGSIEKWRQEIGIEKFHLIGHSLGGYLSSLYALKYPERIVKLTLLSPAGITDVSKGGSTQENMPFGKKLGFFLLGPFWNLKMTMKGMYDNPMSRVIMKPALRKRYEVSKHESELLAKLTEYALQYPKDLDTAIYYIFKNPIPTVRFPLEDRLFNEVKNFKVDIYFGEIDWMDQIGSIRLCERDKDRFKLFMVSKSGHNFNLEKSEELAGYILNNHNLNEELHEINHLVLDNNQEVEVGRSGEIEICSKENEGMEEIIENSNQTQIEENNLNQEK